MKIQSIDRSVSDLLKGSFFAIPRFQRPYSWDRENIEEFWTDIFVNSDADYFIGSMVTYKPGNAELAFVVDGQQRLTTIIMLLAAIRNSLMSSDLSDLAAGVQALIERRDLDNQPQYTLQTETSYPYFQEYIQSSKAPQVAPKVGEEEGALLRTFTYLTDQVEETIASIAKDRTLSKDEVKKRSRAKLSEMRDKILSLKVISIDLDNEDDAYTIFETMNTRGKDLAPSDLVKGHLTKLLRPSNKNVDLTKDAWNTMVEIIEGSTADLDVTTYLHHYWLSRYEYVTVKALYRDVRRKVVKTNARVFLDSLIKDATIYREIQETSYKKWTKQEEQVKDSLRALTLFRVKQPLPMVLAVMHAYNARSISLAQVKDVLGAIEKFHFIFTAVTSQRSSGGISFMYALHARNLLAAKDNNARAKELSELKKKLKDKLPEYAEFESNFVNLEYTKVAAKEKKLVQYVLGKLDRLHSSGLPINYELMTIEHIASQSQNVKSQLIGNIGNLLLCDKTFNEKVLRDKDFAAKKTALLASSIAVDEQIKTASEWTSKEISARAKYLSRLAFEKVWKI